MFVARGGAPEHDADALRLTTRQPKSWDGERFRLKIEPPRNASSLRTNTFFHLV